MRNPFFWDVKPRQQESGSDDPVMRLHIVQEQNPLSNLDRRCSYISIINDEQQDATIFDLFISSLQTRNK
jgi:hypothetical protein